MMRSRLAILLEILRKSIAENGFKQEIAKLEKDVDEVVRCKDCLNYHAMILDKETGELASWGICDQPWFNSDEYDVFEDGYCHDGIRRPANR